MSHTKQSSDVSYGFSVHKEFPLYFRNVECQNLPKRKKSAEG